MAVLMPYGSPAGGVPVAMMPAFLSLERQGST
jgi:hypothetical protein